MLDTVIGIRDVKVGVTTTFEEGDLNNTLVIISIVMIVVRDAGACGHGVR